MVKLIVNQLFIIFFSFFFSKITYYEVILGTELKMWYYFFSY